MRHEPSVTSEPSRHRGVYRVEGLCSAHRAGSRTVKKTTMGDADRLPMANVNRIVMSTLPKDAAVAKEAKVAISACATVFVHYITEL